MHPLVPPTLKKRGMDWVERAARPSPPQTPGAKQSPVSRRRIVIMPILRSILRHEPNHFSPMLDIDPPIVVIRHPIKRIEPN